jgi:hypothetical protein
MRSAVTDRLSKGRPERHGKAITETFLLQRELKRVTEPLLHELFICAASLCRRTEAE